MDIKMQPLYAVLAVNMQKKMSSLSRFKLGGNDKTYVMTCECRRKSKRHN